MFLWISFRITIGFVNLQIVTIYFLWISFRIRIGFVNSFPLNIFYLPIDLALLYRLSPLLYSVDAQITLPKLRKSLHTMFLWISFIITIGFVNLQIVTIYFLWISFRIRIRFVNSSLMDWNGMERKRVSLLNGFLTLFYLPIDLALLYRLTPPLYSVDAQKSPPKNSKSLHTRFLWISFRITIGFVNLQIVTIYFLSISFRIRIGFVIIYRSI